MSEERPSVDIASLFGLSTEEVHGLGLDQDGEPEQRYVEPPPTAQTPAVPLNMGLLAVFMEEAVELLDSLHTCLEQLERGVSESAVIEARRTVHTLKGGARICGMVAIADLAHACEDAIGAATPGENTLPETLVPLLFEAEHEIREALDAPAGPEANRRMEDLAACMRSLSPDPPEPPPATGKAAPQATSPAKAAPGTRNGRSVLLRRPDISTVAPPSNRLAVDAGKVESIVAKVTEIVANRAASQSLMETLATTVTESMRTVQRLQIIAAQLHYHIVSQGLDVVIERGPNGVEMETYGPIHQLLLQLQEAVGDQQALAQATMDTVTNKRSLSVIETRLDADLQGALLHMRLLPLGQLRVRLDQVVRSAAATAKRDVQWTMEGQDVALDKQVTDKLFEPLMHLLRNAIDHGIEPPDEREAVGKPRTGTLAVQASVEGNQAFIAVCDDGRGMDPLRIAATAVTRGLISEAQARLLSDHEKLALIFRPGFSTAAAVTELSGRGIGMDIVKETCTRMGGTVTVTSQPGKGTTITLQVPLSLSIVHALIARDSGRTLIIPASQVLSVQLVLGTAILNRDGRQWVRIGRDELPLYHLSATALPVKGPAGTVGDEHTILVVPYRSGTAAIALEELVNEEDLTVKPLPTLLQGITWLLGAVIQADGTPSPVLNLPPLLDWIEQQVMHSEPPLQLTFPEEQTVLVIDDSLTIRYALTQTLESAGLRVVAARDGREAIEAVRDHGVPHLVTLDLEMPRMDGLETLYAIRHTEGAEHIPIFILTSRSGQQHRRTAMQLGATRYFTKPYQDGEFLRAVQEALGMPIRVAG